MVQPIIEAYPTETRTAADDGSKVLQIAECFSRTIQGENLVGFPATFLRLKNCTLDCIWCDTAEVWRKGNPYSVKELLELFEQNGVLEDLKNGHHLIYTGGSPVKQQEALTELTKLIIDKIGKSPIIEVENECTRMPDPEFASYVGVWNNSPKLANSGMQRDKRIKPEVLKDLAGRANSFWKFVVTSREEWEEIKRDFLEPYNIHKTRVVLMPEGQTRAELLEHYEDVVNLCCEEGLRMTDRLHITIWGKKTGV